MFKLDRIGYGAQFNDLFINDNKIIKKSKTNYGDFKINKEIIFYKYLIQNKICFATPNIYDFGNNYYTMEFLSDYTPLYKLFPFYSQKKKNDILNKIFGELNKLHISTNKLIDKNTYIKLLHIETYTKIKSRYEEIKEILDNYICIDKVNNIKIKTFDSVMDTIKTKVTYFINSLDKYEIAVIHGDCQFNNILVKGDDLVFIDPRGYFGDLDLFGIPQYDYAKVKFALSGYDIFDNMEIDSLEIYNGNLTTPTMFLIEDTSLFRKDDIVSILTISIWLGNAHCFKNNISKCVFSFYYALYLATLYL